MSEQPILYHAPPSYYSMIARLVLAEKGVTYQSHNIDIHVKKQQNTLAYARINPYMSVPTLVHDKTLCSSLDILNYVSENTTGINLQAVDNKLMQDLLDAHYKVEIEDLTMGKFFSNHPFLHKKALTMLAKVELNLRELARQNPELKEPLLAKAQLTAERQTRFSIDDITATYQNAKKESKNYLARINSELQKKPFVAGLNYSLADVVATTFIARLHMINHDDLITPYPKIQQYFKSMQQRPSFISADLWCKVKKSFFIKLIAQNIKDKLCHTL